MGYVVVNGLLAVDDSTVIIVEGTSSKPLPMMVAYCLHSPQNRLNNVEELEVHA